jgi:predicted enzyme related to lactoylglutathione lyase
MAGRRKEAQLEVRAVRPAQGGPLSARYVHTNLIARDWQKLSAFYQEVFGCIPVPPERHYRGPDLERGTGVPGSELHGIHLRLPGGGEHGPTLEIYSYSIMKPSLAPAVNRPGFGHIAFEVDDVLRARDVVLASGGASVGEVVTLTTAMGSRVMWCYLTDPEGNILELQSWR